MAIQWWCLLAGDRPLVLGVAEAQNGEEDEGQEGEADAEAGPLAERLGATRDRSAVWPGDKPVLVYRHPQTGGAK